MRALTTPIILVLVYVLGSCAKINESTFFEPVRSSQYLRDAYQGKVDFTLDSRFDIDQALINPVSFSSFDGQATANLQGVYLGDLNEITNRKVIVYCHDKPGNLDYYWPRIKLLGNLGPEEYGILAFDYRGYGKSDGSPREESIYADTDAALRWLQDKGVTSQQLILYGYGLGAAAAIELSAHPRSLTPQKIILEAPFASIEALLQNDLLQNIPVEYLTNLRFDNADKIKQVSQPLLWLHGNDDKIFRLGNQGQVVFNAHPGVKAETKFAYKISGANHYNVPEKFDNGFDGYLVAVLSFLQNN